MSTQIHISASQLKQFSKCGYYFYLKRVEQVPSPEKNNYGMLHGRIIDDALAKCSVYLNEFKELPDAVVAQLLLECFKEHYTLEQISDELYGLIETLYLQGINPSVMGALDGLAMSINESSWEWKGPGPMVKLPKDGGYSSDIKRFSVRVWKTLEHFYWFFQPGTERFNRIRDAKQLVHQQKFSENLGISAGVEVILDGYLDQWLVTPDDKVYITEWKSDKTAYNQTLVDKMIQTLSYQYAGGEGSVVTLYDLMYKGEFVVNTNATELERFKQRCLLMVKATQSETYIPKCGTDPFHDKFVMCEYKCGYCPYGTGTPGEEMEGVA